MEIDLGHTDHDQDHAHHGGALMGGQDPAFHTLPVHIVDSSGAIRVHQAPFDAASARTKTLGTAAVLIQPADRHRGRVLLLGQAPFLFCFTGEIDPTQDTATQMGWWPANTELEIRARASIYAAAATGTCVLTVMTERTTETHALGVDG